MCLGRPSRCWLAETLWWTIRRPSRCLGRIWQEPRFPLCHSKKDAIFWRSKLPKDSRIAIGTWSSTPHLRPRTAATASTAARSTSWSPSRTRRAKRQSTLSPKTASSRCSPRVPSATRLNQPLRLQRAASGLPKSKSLNLTKAAILRAKSCRPKSANAQSETAFQASDTRSSSQARTWDPSSSQTAP